MNSMDVGTPWVLRRLASSIRRGSKIKLNIPPTVLLSSFRLDHGHYHFLHTGEDGRLCASEPSQENYPQHELDHYHLKGALELIRQLNHGGASCVVWYEGNEHEILGIDFVLKLASSTSWRQQALAVQGHIIPARLETGIYHANEDELFGACGNIRDGAAKVGLNMLTKALARSVIGDDEQECRIDFMRAIYVVDGEGALWFSHASDVRVWPSMKPVEDSGANLVLPAHQLVKSELKRALIRAINSGASIEELFTHFDPFKRGFADSCDLKRGLLNLGIGVSTKLADMLLQELGGTIHFTARDLASFTQHIDDFKVHACASARRTKASAGGNTTTGGPFSPQVKFSAEEQRDKTNVCPYGDEAEGGALKPNIATPQQQDDREQGVTCSGGLDRTDDDTMPPKMLGTRSSSQNKPMKFLWDDLPCWSREASKSALHELMSRHKRSLKKARANTKREATLLTNQPKHRIKPDDEIHGDVSTAGHGEPVSPRSVQRPASGVGTNQNVPRDRKELAKEDLKLHVGGGNVMSYRWVIRSVARPNHSGNVLEAMEALSTSQEAMGFPPTQHETFLLVAMPGLFMTLDSMERTLGGLLEHNPRGKLLLVGSLGLPDTQWADGEVLDAKTHAHGLSTLLWELMERGELCLSPSVCVVLLGLGSGANAVLNFASTFLVHDKFAPLRDSTRFLALINPFPSAAPEASLDVQQTKRRLQALKRILERGAHREQLECLVGAMFSTEHLEKSGRAAVLEEFWGTRQALELPGTARPKSTLVSCSARTPHAEQARGIKPSGGKVGVLECVDGVLRGATLGALDRAVNAPVLLITSTRDALDTSATAEHCRASLEAEDVDSLFKLVSGNKHRRIIVYPVQAGREILQEAPVHTLGILSGAIHAAQTQPIVACPAGTPTYPESCASGDNVLDVLVDSRAIGSPSSLVENGGDLGEYAQIKPPKGRNKETGSGEDVDGSLSAPPGRPCDNPSPKGRRAREFDARKERAAEKKAKNESLKRQQELNRLKRAKREEDEILKQHGECLFMHEEDERSSAVDRHIRGLEVWASSVEAAKERALELTSTRDASDQKLIEDQLARERAQQHVQRNELFRQRKLDLLEQDGGVEDVKISPGGQHDEVEFAREACKNLLDQLFSLRRRIVKTMQMELLRREQLETFQSQYDKLEGELRASQRLQSTYARGGTTAGVLGDVPAQQLTDLSLSVARQHALLGTYQSVLKERREIWELTVSHIQKLKIVISAKESELQTTLQEVRLNMAAVMKKAREIRAKNESLAALRASVESETKTMQNRVKLLTREQSLLNSHDGSYFDSDIWQEGVTQRMSKERFAQALQVELTTLGGAIQKHTRQTLFINETLANGTLEGQAVETTMQKFGQIAQVSQERSDLMNAKTIAQEFRDIVDAEQELKSADPSASAMSSPKHNVAEMIRNRSSHQRSLEEKQWVALDILINKDFYKALSAVENEELQLNDEYKTDLRAEDVNRILGLPREIQLALPHLKSASEIEAHKLLTTYTLEHGEAQFAKTDEQSQDHLFVIPSGEKNTPTSHCYLPGKALATVGAPTKQHRGSRTQDTDPTELHGLSSAKPFAMWTAGDPLDSLKTTLAEVPSVPRHATKPLNLVEAISDVALKKVCENDGEMAIRIGGREVYRSASRLLGIQESRVHSFTIVNHPPIFSVDLKVVINFTGCTDSRGFKMGRVSAMLRRKSAHEGVLNESAGECVGFSPHSCQKLNLGDEFYQTPGVIMIQHCPRRVPLACSTYEVEVTALGPTAYEVVVVAGQCELCASLVDKRLEETRNLKIRLKELAREQNDTWESVRLRERQYHVCNTLIEEAGSECLRCQGAINELCDYLRSNDVGDLVASLPELSSSETASGESGTQSTSSPSTSTSIPSTRTTSISSSSTTSPSDLSETEREETWNEVAAIETEHMHWGRLYSTRCQEKASVKKALHKLMKLRRDGRAEKIRLETELEQMSAEIPIVVEVLQGAGAAAEISRELRSNSGTGLARRSSSDGGLTVSLETPAGRTRQAFERGGWGALTLEEQQWVTMDQELHPEKYEWLHQQQQEGACNTHERGRRKRKKPRKNPAIDQYRFHREELMRILAEPADELNRREMHVWKLLHKFHDDPQLVGLDSPAVCPETHDLLAERTRLKNNHHRTATEKEWISLDKILNPTIWKRAKEGVPGTHNDQRPSEEGRCGILSDEQVWECPFNRDDLLRIWAQSKEASSSTEDEKRAFKLLTTYNGACPDLSKSTNRGWRGVQMGKGMKGLDIGIDLRLRCLQRELDRVAHSSNSTMTSSILHAAPQRYPTSTLRLNLEAEIDRLLREQVQQRERKNVYLIEDFSSSEEEEDAYSQGKKRETRRTRRLNRRTGRGTMNIFDARKRMLLESKKTLLERDNARRIANLGPGGCPACMSNPCKWVPVVNLEDTNSRLERIADELHFARRSTENIIESTLPMSVQRDGHTTFRRVDFIEELSSEQKQLRHMMKLHFIDEEFHEANRTPKQHIESIALHGYRTFLWTKDARVALEREHSRLVARVVAVEVAHEILEWMLEGWHFGERPSQRATLGSVPSKQEGDEASAGDARTSREQEEDKVKMFILPPGVDGSRWDNISKKVVKEGGVHDEEIGFMERTMHFGLFCVAVMYFRARWLLRQQRERALEFKIGWKIDTSVPVRAQRKPVSQTTVSSTQPGYQRVKVRKEKEQAEVLADFAGFVAVEKRELDAAQLVQRILRGHIGRKAAHRWHEKRAEYNATNSLMVAAAVSIQRLLRGSWGRNRARTIRAGIARWLTHLIDDEAREFEAEILSTNKLEALKRGIEELMDDSDSDSRSY